MAQFWLSDGTNTLELDNNIQEMTLGGNKRNYKVVPFAGAAGGFIRGFGTANSKKFIVRRKELAEGGDSSFYNSRRNDYLSWFTRPAYEEIYLYVRDGEDSFTVRTRVYVENIGSEKFSFVRITDMRDIALISPKGLFENITASTDTEAITGSSAQNVSFTNLGTWETPIILKFTPTANETLFNVELADQFGVNLSGQFLAGKEIAYNTADNSLTIDSETQNTGQFLTSGGSFNIPPGDVTLKVQTSGPGSFSYEFNERYS